MYNHDNNYNGLKLGQKIFIDMTSKYGTDNLWYIAGFDCEYNHTASDGTIKDNGYGICLIPATFISNTAQWSYDDSMISHNESYIYNKNFGVYYKIEINLKQILGDHLVNRKVLLGSSVNSNTHKTNKYTWTTSYCPAISIGQCVESLIGSAWSKFDDGEANYVLPLFKFRPYWYQTAAYEYPFLTRSFYGSSTEVPNRYYDYGALYYSFCISFMGNIIPYPVSYFSEARPMIYIR